MSDFVTTSDGCRVPVARDTERFRMLASNGRPKIPAGVKSEIGLGTSRALISARLAGKKA